MNLFMIAWRSMQQRWFASSLTGISMALGVTLIVAVITIHGIVTAQFQNNATLGYNLIVGAKGGRLQLTLNSVYYLSQPVENVSYEFYQEFHSAERRRASRENSLNFHAEKATWDAIATSNAVLGSMGPVGAGVMSAAVGGVLEERTEERLGFDRPGRFADYVEFAIPICMGDYFGPFRVVGTTPEMFDVLPPYLEETGRGLRFAKGRNFQEWNAENGFFEAVIGATAAREMKVTVGAEVFPAHGDPEGKGHDEGFVIVGVLEPTGTPYDRALFVNMEGFYLMRNHAKPLEAPDSDVALADEEKWEDWLAALGIVEALLGSGASSGTESPEEASPEDETSAGEGGDIQGPDQGEDQDPVAGALGGADPSDLADGNAGVQSWRTDGLPVEQREVTALLVRSVNPFVAAGMVNVINEGVEAQAVQPVKEIFELFEIIVTPVQQVLLLLTGMIIVVSGISILVSIYNSMSERRHEIAVMRALGASRGTVMTIILLESILLSLGGGIAGWVLGHALNGLASPIVEARTGIAVGFFDFAPPVNLFEFFWLEPAFETMAEWVVYPELLLIPFLMVLAILVGLLPALSAYRTDVAESLGK
jgi:putative ABC transport system permease protein